MGQPKAKWDQYTEEHQGSDVWTAAVGPFYLEVIGGRGHAELCEYDHDAADIGETLWSGTLATPCDIVDLMLLAEAELERRLRGAAETMDGKELVAEQAEQVIETCVSCHRLGSPQAGGWCNECRAYVTEREAERGRFVTCDFEDCQRGPTHPRGSMTYCDTHAREHDENVAQATRFGMDPGMASVAGIQFSYFCGQCDGKTVSVFEPIESCCRCGEPVPPGILNQVEANRIEAGLPPRMICNHYGNGQPGCKVCDPRTTSLLHPVDTSDKTPLGTVERVNDDGTVLIRVGGGCQFCLQPVPGPEHDGGCPYRSERVAAGGSRAWAIEQLTPGFGGVRDRDGYVWYKPSDGVGYRRMNDGGSDSQFDDLPVDMPDGWLLVT